MLWFQRKIKNVKGKVRINREKCSGCAICLAVCPVKAIILDGYKAKVISAKCINCSICIITCPENAIEKM